MFFPDNHEKRLIVCDGFALVLGASNGRFSCLGDMYAKQAPLLYDIAQDLWGETALQAPLVVTGHRNIFRGVTFDGMLSPHRFMNGLWYK